MKLYPVSRMISKVAIAYNVKRVIPKGKPRDIYAEFDTLETVNSIKKILSRKYNVILIEANEDCYEKFKSEKPDIVFNIAEGLYSRNREAHIPLILEMLKIPYTGSGPLALALGLDKAKTKEILQFYKIPTAESQVVYSLKDKINKNLKFPLILKLVHEGSSMGLYNENIVRNKSELRRGLKKLVLSYKEPVIVEEFLTGKEFTVGIIGNKPKILGILEIYLDKYPQGFDALTYEAKGIKYDDIYSGKPRISKDLYKRICDIALKTHKALHCRDFSRVDIRCDKKGNPHVLEINPLPGLSPSMEHISFFPKIARINNISYDKLINMMINVSLKRIR